VAFRAGRFDATGERGMKLRHVRARQGARWVTQGLQVFFRRPLAFCGLMLLCLLLAPLLLFAMAPLVSVGFMIATGQSLQGRFPLPGVFVEPLRISRRRLYAHMKLCLLYAAGISLVFWLARGIGGGAIDAVMQAVSAGKTSAEELEPLLSATDFQVARFVLLAGVAILSVPFWYAPALVHWGDLAAAKALFFSTMACWRNKGALAVYVLTWGGVALLSLVTAAAIFALLGQAQLIFVAITPAMLMFYAAFYASLYFTFVDSFEPSQPTTGDATPQETP